MTKDEFSILFEDCLKEIEEFNNETNRIKNNITSIIDNYDLIIDNVTDNDIINIFSQINIKMSKIKSDINDTVSDSKKLMLFINEVKLLKRKRDEKIKSDESDLIIDRLLSLSKSYKYKIF